MIPNNNFSVLPFYLNINEQNHRKSYAYGAIYPLFAPANMLLPFQIMRPHGGTQIYSVLLYDANGQVLANLTEQMNNAGLQIVQFPDLGYDIILFPGNVPADYDISEGIHYLRVHDGPNMWYSEMFTVVNEVSGYLKVEWWDIENMIFDAGQIVYQNPTFKNILYLCAELGKPEYLFEEEGEERDGYFFPEKQISEKTYRCTILAPEYLCDVMRFIRMADNVVVTDKYGRVYNCDSFLITPKWQEQGDLASVEIEFQTDTVVKKIARAYGRIPVANGDFNEDFNEDYYNA